MICSIDDCEKESTCRTWCKKHYKRWWRYGDPLLAKHTFGEAREKSRAYRSYYNMLQRCNNPKATEYARYGGRGVKITNKWSTFTAFIADMGECPENLTLERRDNNGDYEPSNCRWANRSIQQINKGMYRNNKSGYKGVYWEDSISKWQAYITIYSNRINLGYFDTKDEAIQKRMQAEKIYHNPLLGVASC